MSGPPPKRSDQRRRRNKTEPIDQAISDGGVRGPELPGHHCDVARRFWEALRHSGQAQFYEPSDWAAAEVLVAAIDAFMDRPSAVLLASINSGMSNLLVTEGDRRRARLELEKPAPPEVTTDVARIDEFRRRLESG